jgi:hypothetical protein
MKRSKRHHNDVLKIEALSILLCSAGCYFSHDVAWYAILFALIIFSLTWHSLLLRLDAFLLPAARRARTGPARSSAQQKPPAQRVKRLPPLRISSTTPLAHPTKWDASTWAAAHEQGSPQGPRVRSRKHMAVHSRYVRRPALAAA